MGDLSASTSCMSLSGNKQLTPNSIEMVKVIWYNVI